MLVIAIRQEALLYVSHHQLEVVFVNIGDLEMIVALASAVGTGMQQLGQLHTALQYALALAADHVTIITVDHNEVDVGILDDGHSAVDVRLTT